MSRVRLTLSILFSILFTATAFGAVTKCAPLDLKALLAKPASETKCFSFDLNSKSLARSIPMNVVVPKGFVGNGESYAIYLHGRSGDRDQLIELDALQSMDAAMARGTKGFLIFTPSGGDHYWVNAAISGEKWGDLIVKDLVEHIEKNFRVAKNSPAKRALFGISMGGAGALQLGLHHPLEFKTVMAASPVFRRDVDIWKPGSTIDEPHDDYDSFGAGDSYLARSPRALCEKLKKRGGTCLPFKNFRLDIGELDPMLDRYPDTRQFIQELKASHPQFQIGLETCRDKTSTAENPERDAHTFTYWRCQMPKYLYWLSAQIT